MHRKDGVIYPIKDPESLPTDEHRAEQIAKYELEFGSQG